jgi:hypothetical protein
MSQTNNISITLSFSQVEIDMISDALKSKRDALMNQVWLAHDSIISDQIHEEAVEFHELRKSFKNFITNY